MRDVYPGFLQLHGFISMNLDRHIEAHRNLFLNLVNGDGNSAQKHTRILRRISGGHGSGGRVLPADGRHGVRAPRPAERRDDASRPAGRSGTDPARRAAHRRGRERRHFRRRPDRGGAPIVLNLPADRQAHWLQPDVGHYGVFNGSRFRAEIAPRISDFILSMGHRPNAKRSGSAAGTPATAPPVDPAMARHTSAHASAFSATLGRLLREPASG